MPGRHVEGVDLLVLILAERVLVVGIGHVEGRPRAWTLRWNVLVFPAWASTGRKRHARALIVERFELRRIQESIGPQAADREEVPDRVRAPPTFVSNDGLVNEPNVPDTFPVGFG